MTDTKSAFHWRAPPDWVWRAIILLLAVGVLVLITTRWNRWESNSRRQSTDDAYLQSDLTPVSAKVACYVRSMPVQDFERVHAGQVLALPRPQPDRKLHWCRYQHQPRRPPSRLMIGGVSITTQRWISCWMRLSKPTQI